MTFLDQIISVLQASPDQCMKFEDIIKNIPSIHGSSAQMMAVYAAFNKGISNGWIERCPVEDPKAPMYVRREFYRTRKEYVDSKEQRRNRAKSRSAQGISS
jgi:hypothetical protein